MLNEEVFLRDLHSLINAEIFFIYFFITIYWLFENNNPGLKGKNLINGYSTDWLVKINLLLR